MSLRPLLDTQVVLWQLHEDPRLGRHVQDLVYQADEVSFSVISFVEIVIKASTGKLRVPAALHEQLVRREVRILNLLPQHGLALADLPRHRDPFDRLLIAQARHDRLTILTADRRMFAYDVPVDASA